MNIEDIKRVIDKKSIKLNADRLQNNNQQRYMWVVSQGVFDKVREYCEYDIESMDRFYYGVEYHINFKWMGDEIKLWKEL